MNLKREINKKITGLGNIVNFKSKCSLNLEERFDLQTIQGTTEQLQKELICARNLIEEMSIDTGTIIDSMTETELNNEIELVINTGMLLVNYPYVQMYEYNDKYYMVIDDFCFKEFNCFLLKIK